MADTSGAGAGSGPAKPPKEDNKEHKVDVGGGFFGGSSGVGNSHS